MICVISQRAWMAEYIGAERHSLGLDLPDTSDFIPGQDGIWCPAHYASLYHLTDAKWGFDDSPDWWTLPEEVLGREVTHRLTRPAIDTDTFVKYARHKYESFPAKIYSPEELEHTLDPLPHTESREYITSEPVDYRIEYRFWVIDGQVHEDSCYHNDVWWWDGEQRFDPAPNTVRNYAIHCATLIRQDSAYTMDIGISSDGNTSLIELNPAWCSGFYSIPKETIRKAVIASQRQVNPEYFFIPDQGVSQTLAHHSMVRRS